LQGLLRRLSTGNGRTRPRAAADSHLVVQSPLRDADSAHRNRPPASSSSRSLPKPAFTAPRQQTASAEIPIASDARPLQASRGFLPRRFADADPVRAAPPSWGRHPQTFTQAEMPPIALFNNRSRARNQLGGYLNSQLFGRLEIDDKVEPHCLRVRYVARIGAS